MKRIQNICDTIRKDYSVCDVSDALLALKVPGAGYLPDILPIPSQLSSQTRIVAPISTLLYVDKDHSLESTYPGLLVPLQPKVPSDIHYTDVAEAGSVIVMQHPSHHTTALLGDILATRYKLRGISGVFVHGRVRDIASCADICRDGNFQVRAKGTTCAGVSLEGKLYGVDVPLQISHVTVRAGDVLVADEAERAACVIPRELLEGVVALLPELKQANDGLLRDIQNGMEFREAKKRHPGHYTNR